MLNHELLRQDNEVFLRQLAGMHLQWFAAEDEGRTEEPTEHKIRKAREDGKVAKSPELASTVVLLATIIAVSALGRWMFDEMAGMLRYFLGLTGGYDPINDRGIGMVFMQYFFKLFLPVSLIALAGAILGNLVQVGFLFTTKPLKPDFKRIMPKFGDYLKRSFASPEALFNLAKALVKVVIIIIITWTTVAGNLDKLLNLTKKTYTEGFFFVASLAYDILLKSAIFLLVVAAVDYWFQRRQFRESLKMTKQEIKEERKSYEGDPLVRSRLRQRMKEILSQNMMKNVPRADVVVTNPTHFAVALEYKKESMDAPMVLAKGQDLLAQRIKEIARENNIPIIENRPLARALYAEVEVGEVIPERFYEAVVVVLRQVYRMKRREREVG